MTRLSRLLPYTLVFVLSFGLLPRIVLATLAQVSVLYYLISSRIRVEFPHPRGPAMDRQESREIW